FFSLFLFLRHPRPQRPPLFPYTTLFRSAVALERHMDRRRAVPRARRPVAERPRDVEVREARAVAREHDVAEVARGRAVDGRGHRDRKSTRLNSSHRTISYAVFCLKKKKY